MKKALFLSLFVPLFACATVVPIAAPFTVSGVDSVVVVFSGDFMQHLPQVEAARDSAGFDYDSQLRYFAPIWREADFALINLETTLSSNGRYSGYPMFSSPSEIAGALHRAGITHVALANNHSLDRSAVGVRHTAQALDAVGIEHTGVFTSDSAAQRTMILSHNGLRIAVINFTYGTNGVQVPQGITVNTPLDTATVGRAIDRAKADSATHTVVFVHFGQEYRTMPDSQQRDFAMWLRRRGVDLVVGSHPHVPQPIDAKNSIVYSLGNFVSNQRDRYTDGGYSVRVKFLRISTRPIIEYIPHYVDLSEQGGERYRVLTISHHTLIEDEGLRRRMVNSINDTRRIIKSEVKYE